MALGLHGRALTAARIDAPGVDLPAKGTILWEDQFQLSSPAAGKLTLQGLGGSNNEDLTFDHETLANYVSIASSTGVTAVAMPTLDFAAQNVAATQSLSAGAASYLTWAARARVYSPADSIIKLTNAAGNDFDRLCWGGISAAEPAIARHASDTDALDCRLADDSGQCALYARSVTVSQFVAATTNIQAGSTGLMHWAGRSELSSPADSIIKLTDAAGTDFDRLQFGGETSSFPAIQRSTNQILFRLADDSTYCNVVAARFATGATGDYSWSGRAKIYSPADSIVEFASSSGSGNPCAIDLNEYASGSDPAAPGASKVYLYVRDNGSGKGELCARFPTGAIQVIASEP